MYEFCHVADKKFFFFVSLLESWESRKIIIKKKENVDMTTRITIRLRIIYDSRGHDVVKNGPSFEGC